MEVLKVWDLTNSRNPRQGAEKGNNLLKIQMDKHGQIIKCKNLMLLPIMSLLKTSEHKNHSTRVTSQPQGNFVYCIYSVFCYV